MRGWYPKFGSNCQQFSSKALKDSKGNTMMHPCHEKDASVSIDLAALKPLAGVLTKQPVRLSYDIRKRP